MWGGVRIKALALGLGIAWLGFLAGCATPRLAKSPDPRATAEAFNQRRLADPAFLRTMTALGIPADEQRRDALTPGLVAAAALTYHADAKTAAADIAAAHADAALARQRPNPTLSVAPERAINTVLGTIPWVVTTALSVAIETNGKRGYRARAGARAEEAAVLTASATLWQVRSRAVAALAALADVEDELTLTRREVNLRRDLVARFAKEQAAGMLSAPEVMRARGDLAGAMGREADASAREVAARSALAAAMGVPLAALENRAAIWPDAATPEAVHLDALQEDAILNRVDLRAKLAAYAQAQDNLNLAMAQRFPDVTLGPGYTYDHGEHRIVLGTSFELPLFHGYGATIAKARADRDRAAASFEGTQADVIAAIEKARAALDGAERSLAEARTAEKEAAGARARVEAQLRRDTASKPDLMQAELIEVQQAEATLVARRALHAAMNQLEDAVEAPIWTPALDMEALSQSPSMAKETQR